MQSLIARFIYNVYVQFLATGEMLPAFKGRRIIDFIQAPIEQIYYPELILLFQVQLVPAPEKALRPALTEFTSALDLNRNYLMNVESNVFRMNAVQSTNFRLN
jgi:hypothetical protein